MQCCISTVRVRVILRGCSRPSREAPVLVNANVAHFAENNAVDLSSQPRVLAVLGRARLIGYHVMGMLDDAVQIHIAACASPALAKACLESFGRIEIKGSRHDAPYWPGAENAVDCERPATLTVGRLR